MINELLLKCSVIDAMKITSWACFRRRLRIVNGENEFYEVMASDER